MPPERMYSAREQNLLDRGRDAALHQDGLAHVAEFAQQVEVLHVARADLEAVDVREHHLDLRDLHDLGDDEQARLVAGLAQELQAFDAHALEAVGRAARLECAAAKKLRAGRCDLLRAEENLIARLYGARAGHDDDLFAADDDAVGEVIVVPSGRKLRPASL